MTAPSGSMTNSFKSLCDMQMEETLTIPFTALCRATCWHVTHQKTTWLSTAQIELANHLPSHIQRTGDYLLSTVHSMTWVFRKRLVVWRKGHCSTV